MSLYTVQQGYIYFSLHTFTHNNLRINVIETSYTVIHNYKGTELHFKVLFSETNIRKHPYNYCNSL